MHSPVDAFPLPFPVRLTPWAVAKFSASRDVLRRAWGAPHFVEDDAYRTAGGDEDNWAWELPSGHRLLVVLAVPYRDVNVFCDPPDTEVALDALGVERATVPDLVVFEKPILLA